MKISIKEIILFGILGGFVSVSQLALNFIPNIEIVTLLIILFSLIYKKKTLYIVYIYVFIMGIVYGFGIWWFGYVILWPLLSIITSSASKYLEGKYIVLAIYSGIFGLMFGFFYSIPYTIFGGIKAGIAYWITGLQFDIIHGVGNYFIMCVIGKRLFDLLNKLNNKYIN